MIEPGHDQGTEQGIVGCCYLAIADAVEQCAVDEFRPNQPELTLAQARKHIVVCSGFIGFEKGKASLVILYPSATLFDELLNLSVITATANHLDALTFSVHFLHDAHGGTARFVPLLFDKHATKIAIFLHMVSGWGRFSCGYPPKIGLNHKTR